MINETARCAMVLTSAGFRLTTDPRGAVVYARTARTARLDGAAWTLSTQHEHAEDEEVRGEGAAALSAALAEYSPVTLDEIHRAEAMLGRHVEVRGDSPRHAIAWGVAAWITPGPYGPTVMLRDVGGAGYPSPMWPSFMVHLAEEEEAR